MTDPVVVPPVPPVAAPQVWSWLGMAPADWATISLTAATVVIAVLAVIIGIGAIFGWKVMRDGAKQAGRLAAQGAATKGVEAYLASEGFKEMVRAEAQAIVKDTILDQLLSKSGQVPPSDVPPERMKD